MEIYDHEGHEEDPPNWKVWGEPDPATQPRWHEVPPELWWEPRKNWPAEWRDQFGPLHPDVALPDNSEEQI